jgi:hypothetical protein
MLIDNFHFDIEILKEFSLILLIVRNFNEIFNFVWDLGEDSVSKGNLNFHFSVTRKFKFIFFCGSDGEEDSYSLDGNSCET